MSVTVDDVLTQARVGIPRIAPAEIATVLTEGGFVVDVRPESRRAADGHIPGAVVIDRLVLEWRLAPDSDHRGFIAYAAAGLRVQARPSLVVS